MVGLIIKNGNIEAHFFLYYSSVKLPLLGIILILIPV